MRRLTETHKRNISIARKGYVMPEEQKQKLSLINKGKVAWNKGRKLSAEHCANLSLSHIGKPSHRRKSWIRTCKYCGKVWENRNYRGPAKYCSFLCYRKSITGEGSYLWKGGASYEPYPLGWTRIYKEQIRHRDSYRCQICGVPEVECMRKLDVHHIDYNKNNIEASNLISVCVACHTRTNHNREHWKSFLENRRKEWLVNNSL